VSTLLGLLASVAYGSSDFLGGLASRRAPVLAVLVISQTVALVLALLMAPALGSVPNAREFAFGAAAGLAYGVGVLLLYRGLAVGRMSVVAPITGVSALVLPVVVGMALGEQPGALALAGIVFAAVAITLVSREADSNEAATTSRADPASSGHTVVIALGAGVGFGGFFVALAPTSPSSGLWPLLATRLVTVVGFSLLALLRRVPPKLPRSVLPIALAGGALDIAANCFYLFSLRSGLLSLSATLTSLYPATTVLLAALLLRERIGGAQRWGLLCAAVAVLAMTVDP